ncbi:MAG: cytochrome C [Anaerolineae bacterium]|nr:cytochrome C [Anaerolineae bacterium]
MIQFIPVAHTDPPITREIRWDSPQTQELAQRACFDCHSNETIWPWYTYVAPVSWRVANHVYEGRRRLNFSEWDRPNENEERIVEDMTSGRMPLWDYLLLHPKAELTPTEQQALIDGLKQTLANDPPIPRPRRPQE